MVMQMASACYAFLDENNIVVNVIRGMHEDAPDENGNVVDWEQFYAQQYGYPSCKRTSYNTLLGKHTLGGTPFRKNYAAIGYVYDPVRDAFYEPQPFPSWTLNEETCGWECSVPYIYNSTWDESSLSWIPLD